MSKKIIYSSIFALFFPIFINAYAIEKKSGTVFQVATISSLAQGVYEGNFSYAQLFKHGDFGLGTFNHLDGEMVAVDGKFYQIVSSGKLKVVQPTDLTPFAEVNFFKPTEHFVIQDVDNFQALTHLLLKHFSNKNRPYAIRIDGEFAALKMRSVKKQEKPYPPLLTVAKNQAVFDSSQVKGTIVGYWFPQYWAGIAVPGFHLHFVNADRTTGGHVLELSVTKAKVALESLNAVEVSLPDTADFAAVNLSDENIHRDIEKVEKNS